MKVSQLTQLTLRPVERNNIIDIEKLIQKIINELKPTDKLQCTTRLVTKEELKKTLEVLYELAECFDMYILTQVQEEEEEE